MRKTLIAIVFLPALALAVGAEHPAGEAPALPDLFVNDARAREGNSGAEAQVRYPSIRLSALSVFTVTFQYGVSDGTAFSNIDFGPPFGGTIVIPPGVISATIPVNVFGGNLFDSEPDETMNLAVFNVQGAMGPFPDGTAVMTITNDDNLVSLSPSVVAIDEGNPSDFPTFNVTASVSPTASFPISIDLASADGTARAIDLDYMPFLQTVTIPAFGASQAYTVTVEGDGLAEDDEYFFVGALDVRNAVLAPSSPITIPAIIVDDDNRCGTTLDGLGGEHFTAGCTGGTTPAAATIGASPAAAAIGASAAPATPYFGFDIARDLEYARNGRYVLDGFGGVHADGGAAPLMPNPTFIGWDIAEDLEFLCDGSGAWMLDGFGGIHPAGGASPPSSAPPYFGFDIARDMELTCPGLGLYVLDGFGGLHTAAGAPTISPAPPYFGFDIAKDLELPCMGPGAYVLDGFGGVHVAGGAAVINPAPPYFGFDAAVDMELTCPATGMVVLDGFGGFHFAGTATPVSPTPPYFGFHIAQDFEGIQ